MSIDRSLYPGVPEDFPITAAMSALGGVQPKLSMVEDGGRYYAVGTSPSEVREAYEVCEDLVQQMIPYCKRKLDKFNGNQEATLGAVFDALLGKSWCSRDQAEWVVRHTAIQLQWPARDGLFYRDAG
jgi:hypothetical protein